MQTGKQPLVSVIIPAYNAGSFIPQTLDSVLSQTYKNIEVIVVDDGSQDQTPQLVQSIAERDDRVLLFRQTNKGVAAARNSAIERSRGEYIAPIDADDIWHPQKIEKQVQCVLQGVPSVGLVYSWWINVDEEGSIIYSAPKWRVEGEVYEELISLNFVGNASVPLIRRACIEHVGGYNSRLRERGGQGCEDWDLSLRIAEHYQLRVVPAYLVAYRSTKSNMARNYTTMTRSHELMIEDIKQRRPDILDKIYQQSKSHFYLYLAGVNYKDGNYRGALHWLYEAWRSGHLAILSPWVAKLIFNNLLRIATKPIRFLIKPDRRTWLNFKQSSSFSNRENNSLPELGEGSKSKTLP